MLSYSLISIIQQSATPGGMGKRELARESDQIARANKFAHATRVA